MPKFSQTICSIVIEKTEKDVKKVRKMSTRVQIWTWPERLNVANWTAIAPQVESFIRRVLGRYGQFALFGEMCFA
jgi:hypothetical protein